MNAVQSEADTAIAHEYETVLAGAGGKQAEGLEIDGRPIHGTVFFDPTQIEIVMGGTNQDLIVAVRTLKRYWPGGQYPKTFKSSAEMVVGGRVERYQVLAINGNRDNRATLTIGLGAYTNRGK